MKTDNILNDFINKLSLDLDEECYPHWHSFLRSRHFLAGLPYVETLNRYNNDAILAMLEALINKEKI